MRRQCATWLAGLIALSALGCLPAPVLWSPDGRWLAYTLAVRSDPRVLKPGWLFETTPPPPGDELGWGDAPNRPQARAHRIWATRADTGVSVLLEESAGPLTSPSWSPDGKALAFGRMVAEADGHARFEVVVQDGPERKHVLLKQPAAVTTARALDLPAVTIAWSPDGRYLAVPSFQQTLGLLIVRSDNGRVLKEIADAYFPAWSPDGTKLAFIRGTERRSLHCLDTNFGPARQLDDIGHVLQPPVWSRDKRSVMVVVRRMGRQTVDTKGYVSVLLRMPVEGGNIQTIPLPADVGDRDRPELGTSFSFDQDGQNLFFTIDAERQQSVVTWFLPHKGETLKKDNPIDFTVRISALGVAPAGNPLAFRAGGPHFFAPPGLWDVPASRFTPVVPDDSARVQWIATLVAAARRLLVAELPPPTNPEGRTIERATLLPIPGEMAENQPTRLRLRKLGKLGAALCDRPADAPPAQADVAELIEEARLFFAYLRGDYDAALGALELVEARTSSADHRLRLLSLRAQVYLGKRQDERAERTIEFLQSLERKAPRRFEMTPAGLALTAEEAPGRGWPKYLDARAREFLKAEQERGEGVLGQHNLLNPMPPHVDPLPAAPGNFLELRADDVPVLIGNGEVAPPEGRRLPRRLEPVRPPPPRPVPRRQFRGLVPNPG